jgi:hypothetical protein
VRVRPFAARCFRLDHVQAIVRLPCSGCGVGTEVLVHLADCRDDDEREARLEGAFENPRCAACAGRGAFREGQV